MIRPHYTSATHPGYLGARQGTGIMDTVMGIARPASKLLPILQGVMGPLQAWFYGTVVANQVGSMLETMRSTVFDLPPLEPEIQAFVANTRPEHEPRNKQILTKILDINRRYQPLNTTPAQAAFNRVLHTTALNAMRNPDKAAQYLGEAEITLAKLYRDYLGSRSSLTNQEDSGWAPLKAANDYLWAAPGKVVDYLIPSARATWDTYGYAVQEPISAADATKFAQGLPSDVLYNTPFPRGYLPTYARGEKMIAFPTDPTTTPKSTVDRWPDYKPPPAIGQKKKRRKKPRYYNINDRYERYRPV